MNIAHKTIANKVIGFPFDYLIVGPTVFFLIIGLVMVGSASTEISARDYNNLFYLTVKHGFYILLSVAMGVLMLTIPIRVWKKLDWFFLLLSFLLLIVVLIPGVGHTVNGSTRWIRLGFFTLHGSEFVKLFALFFIAGYLVRYHAGMRTSIIIFFMPLILVGLLIVLLLLQPDFGASVVLMAAMIGVIFLAGAPFKYFLPLLIVFSVVTSVLIASEPYRLQRLTSFTDPWVNQFSDGYQLTQALIAFGRGEWLGLGLGNSIQKLFFLPEAHTDFLFSILVEELGVLTASILVLGFLLLVLRGLKIGAQAQAKKMLLHSYMAYGVALLIGIQAAINIGVNLGLLPTKGLTLPLVSFGGNSLLVSCMLIGLLLRVEYETRVATNQNRDGK